MKDPSLRSPSRSRRFPPQGATTSHTILDRSQNLQIHGDVNIVSSGGSTHDDPTFVHVSQRAQATKAQSRVIKQGFKLLCKNASPAARYGSGESFTGPRCHPGTRIAVQDYIFKWLDDEDGQIAMWMHGPVGIGKSAIAQTVAHQAAERGKLSSAFFFFRSDDTRNSARNLVPTLAYEMTQQMPHTRDPVCQTIGANPLLFSSPLDSQISNALLRPLSVPSEGCPQRRMLIIIDGLDECLDTETQQAIIRSFILGFLRVAEETIPHKILIVSRPESHIASAMSASDINPHVKYLALESWNTKYDIRAYLRAKLNEIKETHPLKHYLPDVWPGPGSFRELRERSVGSFAYASVAIRHLACYNNNPERALQDLLSLQPNRAAVAFADLDALYRHILLSIDEEMRFILQKVLCLFVYCSRGELDALAARLLEDKSMVELALLRVSALIKISKSDQSITFHHTSFEEFLCDQERSGDLYVFAPNVTGAVVQALSSLWLHPFSNMADYWWFDYISTISYEPYNHKMYVDIINALVATKIPASFLYPFSARWESAPCIIHKPIVTFMRIILEQRENKVLGSSGRRLLDDALNVMCAWLRSHFNLFFQNAPTPNDVLDSLLEDWHNRMGIPQYNYPFLCILHELGAWKLFYCIMGMFPDIDSSEIFSLVLKRYLALPSNERMEDETHPWAVSTVPMLDETRHWAGFTVPMLYRYVLIYGAPVTGFCQKLEQIIVMGRRALGAVTPPYVTPRDYILRFLYGDKCYIDSEYQMAVGYQKEFNNINPHWILDGKFPECFRIAKRTDDYIRQAHREHDFAYISEEVENLYRAASPMFCDENAWRPYYVAYKS